jgi:ArsR family transcriptional regulator
MKTSQILKSIADDTRLAIIRKLASEHSEVACGDIVKDCALALKLSQPTMSHHFSKLAQSGVILERKTGKEKFYTLNYELLSNLGIDPKKL